MILHTRAQLCYYQKVVKTVGGKLLYVSEKKSNNTGDTREGRMKNVYEGREQ